MKDPPWEAATGGRQLSGAGGVLLAGFIEGRGRGEDTRWRMVRLHAIADWRPDIRIRCTILILAVLAILSCVKFKGLPGLYL